MVTYMIFLLLVTSLRYINCEDPLQPITRIVNGKDAQLTEFPYQVSLRQRTNDDKGNHFCGGSLIELDWVLTAAHCTTVVSQNQMVVVVGTIKRSTGGLQYAVRKIIRHKDYNRPHLQNDIAVMKIDKAEYGPAVQTIPLSSVYTPGEVECVITGWGYTDEKQGTSENLQVLNVTTLSRDECIKDVLRRGFTYHYPSSDTQICTLSPRGTGTCQGDSGGPLVHNNEVVGIASWSICAKGVPDGFTRVSAYINWIKNNIRS